MKLHCNKQCDYVPDISLNHKAFSFRYFRLNNTFLELNVFPSAVKLLIKNHIPANCKYFLGLNASCTLSILFTITFSVYLNCICYENKPKSCFFQTSRTAMSSRNC